MNYDSLSQENVILTFPKVKGQRIHRAGFEQNGRKSGCADHGRTVPSSQPPRPPSPRLLHVLAAVLTGKHFGKGKLGSEHCFGRDAKSLPCLFSLFGKHFYNPHQYSLYRAYF